MSMIAHCAVPQPCTQRVLNKLLDKHSGVRPSQERWALVLTPAWWPRKGTSLQFSHFSSFISQMRALARRSIVFLKYRSDNVTCVIKNSLMISYFLWNKSKLLSMTFQVPHNLTVIYFHLPVPKSNLSFSHLHSCILPTFHAPLC